MSESGFKSLHFEKESEGYRLINDSDYTILLGYIPKGKIKMREFCLIAPGEFCHIPYEINLNNLLINIKDDKIKTSATWISKDEK